MPTPQNEKLLLAEAAEHLVLSRLLRLGYPASQAPRTWRADDILIDQGPSFQVKATKGGLNWMVGQVHQNKRQFYAFVDFREQLAPAVYVMKNADVRKAIAASYAVNKEVHPTWKETGIANIRDPWRRGTEPPGFPNGWLNDYLERWGQLPPPINSVPDVES